MDLFSRFTVLFYFCCRVDKFNFCSASVFLIFWYNSIRQTNKTHKNDIIMIKLRQTISVTVRSCSDIDKSISIMDSIPGSINLPCFILCVFNYIEVFTILNVSLRFSWTFLDVFTKYFNFFGVFIPRNGLIKQKNTNWTFEAIYLAF